MSNSLDIFAEIPCLTERSQKLNGIMLQKKWFKKADKRIIGQYLQKFITYNSDYFEFIGVQPFIIGSDNTIGIEFRTSGYIGAIPLRASDTGKQIGDFIVIPRFISREKFEDYIELLNLLGKSISPEVIDSLPLKSGNNFRPPLYMEAVKFISVIELLTQHSWRKFNNVNNVSHQPTGQINWGKYVENEFKVEKRLHFPVRQNGLSEYHDEYAELKYVYNICKHEILSPNTPFKIKNLVRNKLNILDDKLYEHKPKVTDNIIIHSSDSPIIKECKSQANKILNFNFDIGTAWRVDFSDVFEKFIQFIFKNVAKATGGILHSNFKFRARSSQKYSWEQKHLEADAIYQKDKLMIHIDAKYKSNLFNKYNMSEILKENHRHDLHQILAYSSFSNKANKYGILCYPSNELQLTNIDYKNSINGIINTIYILGVPLNVSQLNEITQLLVKEISILFEKNNNIW